MHNAVSILLLLDQVIGHHGSRLLVCSKIWDRELIEEEIEALMSAFAGFAKVSCTHSVSIISLICNVARTSNILERVTSLRCI